jgi:hypothetical protein
MDKNDIPLQKRACREFIIKNNWKLVREYYEKGVLVIELLQMKDMNFKKLNMTWKQNYLIFF